MKRIEAFVKPFRLETIRQTLAESGFGVMRVTEAHEFGKETFVETTSGTSYEIESIPRLIITVVVADSRADEVITAIQRAAVTGHAGDGRIVVSDVERVVSVDGSE